MRFKQNYKRVENVSSSPMADIAFLLIIFFMVSAVFSVRKGIDFKIPQQEDESVTEEKAVLIDIAQEGQISINAQNVLLTGVKPLIKETSKQGRRGRVDVGTSGSPGLRRPKKKALLLGHLTGSKPAPSNPARPTR